MKLLFKQRLFSWFDSYDIYDENGSVVYTVKGQLSWGHKLVVFDSFGNEVGTIQQKVLSFLPRFEIYKQGRYVGSLSKEFSFFRPKYNIEYNGWYIEGSYMEWDYTIFDNNRSIVAVIRKELLRMTDTYVMDIQDTENVIDVLMFVLAMDAEKCSRD